MFKVTYCYFNESFLNETIANCYGILNSLFVSSLKNGTLTAELHSFQNSSVHDKLYTMKNKTFKNCQYNILKLKTAQLNSALFH